jgi:predicted TPR repeat methyltransferase
MLNSCLSFHFAEEVTIVSSEEQSTLERRLLQQCLRFAHAQLLILHDDASTGLCCCNCSIAYNQTLSYHY